MHQICMSLLLISGFMVYTHVAETCEMEGDFYIAGHSPKIQSRKMSMKYNNKCVIFFQFAFSIEFCLETTCKIQLTQILNCVYVV